MYANCLSSIERVRRFSVPRILQCPAGIDHGAWSFRGLDARQDEFRLSEALL